MTDHRATDLSYGQLGEISYDVEENQWITSANLSERSGLQQLLPFRQAQPASLQTVSGSKVTASLVRSQAKQIAKRYPELVPGNAVAREFAGIPSSPQNESNPGRLLAFGGAIDVEHLPGHRTKRVIALSYGASGHVLRLIRPLVETCTWGPQSSASLTLLDASSTDYGLWVSTEGTIQQITFAEDGDLSSTWLAVRQASSTTIFRPLYHKQPIPAMVPPGLGIRYPSSRLSPNPVASVTAESTGSKRHVDVAFNPFYTRQFALIDETGSWSVWDIEGRLRKRSTLDVILGRRGSLHDEAKPDPSSNPLHHADGWHRVLWVTSESMIVVCSRRHLAVFDIKTTPTRLPGVDLLPASSTDWILDVDRSIKHPNHLFVLTSSRVFWLDIIAAREDEIDGKSGLNILLSYRHFRDPNDESMRLAVLKEAPVSVLLYSSRSLVLNYFTFSTASGVATSSQGSFILTQNLEEASSDGRPFEQLQTLKFVDALLSPRPSRVTGPELQYLERDVHFFQVWALTQDLALRSSLLAVHSISDASPNERLIVRPPDYKSSVTGKLHGTQYVDRSFVVPDSSLEEIEISMENLGISQGNHVEDDVRLRINWQSIFKSVFFEISQVTSHRPDNMSKVLELVFAWIRQGEQVGVLPLKPIFQISQLPGFSEDLEQAAPILQDFLESIERKDDTESTMSLTLNSLMTLPNIKSAVIREDMPKLIDVYDHIADIWIASLPLNVSNPARLSKFRLARRIAVEVCLSSIAVYLRDKSSQPAETSAPDAEKTQASSLERIELSLREESLPYFSSQPRPIMSQDAGMSLPTPTRTPSIYSQSSAASEDPVNDPAILRLRQYAVAIEPPAVLGKWKSLSHWPAAPGMDPSSYDWEASQKPMEEDEADEKQRREWARRKRRTEKFLRRERSQASQPEDQSALSYNGSQPEAARVFSSQTVDELPMTQPDRGTFGSRASHPSKKKKPKKRRAAGF